MKTIITFCILLFSITISSTSFSQIYTFSNATNGAPNYVHTNATGSNITAYGGSTNTPCAQGYSGRDGFNVSSYSTSNPSLGIVVKPNTGYQLNITGFTVRSRRSGTGPQNIRMAYSLDGGSTWIDKGSNDAPKNGSCATNAGGTNQATWSVSLTVTNTTNGIMFRVFPFNASGASGTIQIWGAFDINGTVTAASSCTPPALTPTVSHVTCNGGSDGAISLATSGGTSPFTFSWTGPNSYNSTSQNISGLKAGIYTVIVAANGGCKDTIDVTVTEPANTIPSVNISVSPGDTICTGMTAIFTAVSTNGGSSPSYQWKKNGINVGTNSATYSDNSLNNGDTINCIMTSNATCASPTTATSNTIKMTVNALLGPSVTIAANPGNTICAGTPVIFTATHVNGGTSPMFQWRKNGVNVGSNSTTYADNNLANGDQVTCILTSNACPINLTDTGNIIIMTVNPNLTPSVIINASATTICAGINVTFTATHTNGGTPAYQWKINGANAGSNSSSFSTTNLANNDVVTCIITTSLSCVTSTTATSSSIMITVNPVLTPSINITPDKGIQVCKNQTVVFTATASHPGSSPIFQWKKNGINVGSNTNTYSDGNLVHGDNVSCVMTSNALCASPVITTSNVVTMTVDSLSTSQVFLTSSSNDSVCADEVVTFYCHFTNGGSGYKFQWLRNGIEIPSATWGTYTTNSLGNNDRIQCRFTNGYKCPIPATTTPINIVVSQNHFPAVSIKAVPGVTVPGGANVTFTTTTTDAGTNPTFQWMKNNKDIPGGTGNTYSASDLKYNDKIAVKMRTILPCTDKAFALSNVITMKTDHTDVAAVSTVFNTLELYPNPTTGKFTIKGECKGHNREASIHILNNTGQLIHQSEIEIADGNLIHNIDVSNISPGIYILCITVDNEHEYIRFTLVK